MGQLKGAEQALVAVVQQAYVCGVSTRRVDQLVESLGLRISKSEVSRIAGLLDEQVQAFRQRPLEGRYPYLFVDAKITGTASRRTRIASSRLTVPRTLMSKSSRGSTRLVVTATCAAMWNTAFASAAARTS